MTPGCQVARPFLVLADPAEAGEQTLWERAVPVAPLVRRRHGSLGVDDLAAGAAGLEDRAGPPGGDRPVVDAVAEQVGELGDHRCRGVADAERAERRRLAPPAHYAGEAADAQPVAAAV